MSWIQQLRINQLVWAHFWQFALPPHGRRPPADHVVVPRVRVQHPQLEAAQRRAARAHYRGRCEFCAGRKQKDEGRVKSLEWSEFLGQKVSGA